MARYVKLDGTFAYRDRSSLPRPPATSIRSSFPLVTVKTDEKRKKTNQTLMQNAQDRIKKFSFTPRHLFLDLL
jgi:hypothetical protein